MYAAIKKISCKKCNHHDPDKKKGTQVKKISNSYESEDDSLCIRITCTWCGTKLATIQRRDLHGDQDHCSTISFIIFSHAGINNSAADEV